MWKSSVKYFKHNIKLVVTSQLFTFEVFNTFVIEIEGILNSRPLTPIFANPNNFLVLTPDNFLTGDGLTYPPKLKFGEDPHTRFSNWQDIKKIRQHF